MRTPSEALLIKTLDNYASAISAAKAYSGIGAISYPTDMVRDCANFARDSSVVRVLMLTDMGTHSIRLDGYGDETQTTTTTLRYLTNQYHAEAPRAFLFYAGNGDFLLWTDDHTRLPWAEGMPMDELVAFYHKPAEAFEVLLARGALKPAR